MARGPCTFRQLDLTRALRAAAAADMKVHGYKIAKDGTITVLTEKPDAEAKSRGDNENEWDGVK